ncbi:hypothetical protein LTR12_006473 [Friedmanniomyces endolithicus]|nr:hypothetical protein LTR74_012998 [Friedmanniomyces endolithicus]KAK1819158.1 hypothetical protein LTR12_006473 [Friedmanniomyces endolithicus]
MAAAGLSLRKRTASTSVEETISTAPTAYQDEETLTTCASISTSGAIRLTGARKGYYRSSTTICSITEIAPGKAELIPQHQHPSVPPRTMPTVNGSHRALSAALLRTSHLIFAKHTRIAHLDSERAAHLLSNRDQILGYAAGLGRLIAHFAENEIIEHESACSISLASVDTVEDADTWPTGCEPVRTRTFFTVDSWHVAKGAWVEAWLDGVSDVVAEDSSPVVAAAIVEVWTPELGVAFPPALDSDGFTEWAEEAVPRYVEVSEAKKGALLAYAAPQAAGKRKVATGDIWGDLLSAGGDSSAHDSITEHSIGTRSELDAQEIPTTSPTSSASVILIDSAASGYYSAKERFTSARSGSTCSATPATTPPSSFTPSASDFSGSIDARLDHALASSAALLAQAREQLAHQPSSTDPSSTAATSSRNTRLDHGLTSSTTLLADAREQLAHQPSSASSSSITDTRLDYALTSSTALLAQAREQLAYRPSSSACLSSTGSISSTDARLDRALASSATLLAQARKQLAYQPSSSSSSCASSAASYAPTNILPDRASAFSTALLAQAREQLAR